MPVLQSTYAIFGGGLACCLLAVAHSRPAAELRGGHGDVNSDHRYMDDERFSIALEQALQHLHAHAHDMAKAAKAPQLRA